MYAIKHIAFKKLTAFCWDMSAHKAIKRACFIQSLEDNIEKYVLLTPPNDNNIPHKTPIFLYIKLRSKLGQGGLV